MKIFHRTRVRTTVVAFLALVTALTPVVAALSLAGDPAGLAARFSRSLLSDASLDQTSDEPTKTSSSDDVEALMVTFVTEGDSYVQESNPTANFGSNNNLVVDATPDQESYFRFTVSGLSGSVQSARLRVYNTNNSLNGPAVYGTDTNWTETGITWNTRPTRGTTPTEDKGEVGINVWVEYDVTPLVGGNGTYSFVLVPTSTDSVSMSSRQGLFVPELVVTTSPAGTTPTGTSTLTSQNSATPTGAAASPTGSAGTATPTPVDTTPPTVSITAPLSGTTYLIAQTVVIAALATDNVRVTRVEFYDNGVYMGSEDTSPFAYSWAISSANNGAHRWTARAFDPSNNQATSQEVLLNVNVTGGGGGGTITASVETLPVHHSGDAADDPAVWVHPTDPALSTIIGTDKLGGLAVYDLGGNELYYYADSRPNNVDIRYNFPLGWQRVTIVATSSLDDDAIRLYKVNPTTRGLEYVAARTIGVGMGLYGQCMYHSPTSGKYYVLVNDNSGTVQQWELFDAGSNRVDATRVRTFSVGSTTEGCVADDELSHFYVSEEDVAIWRYGAEPNAGTSRVRVDHTGSGGHLTMDIEGLAIYYAGYGGGNGYLIASSQGSNNFVVYDRRVPSGGGANTYLKSFNVVAGTVDEVTYTDGLDVMNFPLGPAFPEGAFIAQDDRNNTGNQNFKLVPWGSVARSGSPQLLVDTSWDPRRVGEPAGSTPTQPPGATNTSTRTSTPPPPTFTPTSTRTSTPAFTASHTATAANPTASTPTKTNTPPGQSSPTQTATHTSTSTHTAAPAFTATSTPTTQSEGCESVTWTNQTNVSVSGNSIQKTGGASSTWDGSAVSTRAILGGNGYVQATVDAINSYRMFGLSNGDSSIHFSDIDFAAYLAGNTLMVYERGVYKGTFGTLAVGDVVRVGVEGGVVKYYRNGSLLYTSTQAPTYPLLLDTAINSMLGRISNAVMCGTNLGPSGGPTSTPTQTSTPAATPTAASNCQSVAWATPANVTVTGNSIQKTGGAGSTWDAGAVSDKAIMSGDGYVQATVDALNSYRMFGLSNGNSNVLHTDIDYAAYLAGSNLIVYERGVNRGSFGTLAVGDVVRVGVEGGVVKYYRNGALVYTSTQPPTYPLLLDTAINSMLGRISNALICGADLGFPFGSAFYVDSAGGNDSNSGTSEASAWRTLGRANSAPLAPGERLLLKRGSVWAEALRLNRSGAAGNPITVGAYGAGAFPIIRGVSSCVELTGSHLVLQEVQTDNCTWAGVEVSGNNNRVQNSLITNNVAGVHVRSGATNNSVLNNVLRDNNRMSVLTVFPTDDDSGAFGVLLHGDNTEVAYNTISGCDAFSYDYGRDGGAIEVYGGRNNTIHHNLAFDNDAFSELGNSRSADNTFAYNVVRSSLATSVFLVTRGATSGYGPVARTRLYNNSVYFTGATSQGFVCHGGCNSDVLIMRNNVIQAVWKVGYADAPFDEDYDLFFGGILQFTRGSHSLVANPAFVDAPNGNLRLQSSSPAIDRGTGVGLTQDFDGVAVPQDGDGNGSALPDMGAFEYRR